MEIKVHDIGLPTWTCPKCGDEIPEGYPIDAEEGEEQ
jgi:hypothetical protein|tara:strand:- start:1126 stop:1236 length:111 start_codon:yes stop_codon:yes gene_type:complete